MSSAFVQILAGSLGGFLAGGDPGVPEWVPPGAIGFGDLRTGVNGNYWDGTAAVTADEMFASDETDYGVRWSSAALTASGFPGGAATEASDYTTPGGKITGLLGDAMLDGCIIVATFSRVSGGGGADGAGVSFEATHQPDWDTDLYAACSDAGGSTIRDYGGGGSDVFTDDPSENGVSKFAVEFDPGTSLKASVNGAAVISTTAVIVGGHAINRLNFKVMANVGGNDATCHLETLAVYPVGYAALDTLTD